MHVEIAAFLGEPREGETFAICGGLVTFDVRAAYLYLLGQGTRDLMRLNVAAFAPLLEQVELTPAKQAAVDIHKAGILAHFGEHPMLVDGNHRLAERVRRGFEGMPVFVLSGAETRRFLDDPDVVVIG